MCAKGTPLEAKNGLHKPQNAYWPYWPYKRDNPTAKRSAGPSADGGDDDDDKSATQRYLRRWRRR
ncbi:MAG: hypothetical protein SPE65_04865 [Muribaculaceae bacterium]|nr:hypothetical protein [Muribaculaceae bacterium]